MFSRENNLMDRPINIHALMCLLTVTLIVLGVIQPIFSILAFALLCGYIVIAKYEDVFLILFFIMPFACAFKTAPTATSLFTYVQLVAIVKLAVLQKKFDKKFVATFVVWLIFLIAGSHLNYTVLIKQAIIIPFVYLFFAGEKIDIKRFVLTYANGILLSSIIALFNDMIPNMTKYIVNDMTFELESDVVRFSALYSDPNYYTLALILALSGLIALYVNKLIGVRFYIYFALIVAFGVQTVSKSFLLLLGALCVLFIVSLIQNKKYKEFVIVLGCLGVVVFFVASKRLSSFDNIIERIVVSLNDGDFTTNRTNIWSRYIDYFKEHPVLFFVGNGVGAAFLGAAPHNTYIDFLYFYGIFGTVFFLAALVAAMLNIKKNKKSFVNYVPIVCMLINFFFLSNLMYYDLIYTLIFSLFILTWNFKETKQSTMLTN